MAVPINRSNYNKIETYQDFPQAELDKISHFFEHYKDLEKGKWVKVMLKNSKDLYISSFYMPHRNINDINKLSESITMVNNGNEIKFG
jgi:hypothetical protein